MLKWFALAAFLLLAVPVAMVMNWYGNNFHQFTHRYRLSLEMTVNGVPKVGTTVIEIEWHEGPRIFPWSSNIRGQAAFIDIRPYGGIIAALWPIQGAPGTRKADGLAVIAWQKERGVQPPSLLDADNLRELAKATGEIELSSDDMPQLLWVPDLERPESTRPIRPDEFPSTFDGNVQFKRAWVTFTDEPISHGLENVLPAFAKLHEAQKGGFTVRADEKFFLNTNAIFGVDNE